MRPVIFPLFASACLVVAACSGTGTNSADLFTPQIGSIQLTVSTSDTTIQSVDFQLNGKSVGTDTDASDGWALPFDTTQYPNGIYTLTAIGTSSSAGQVQLLNNSLLIQNPAGAATTPPTNGSDTTPIDEGSGTASDDGSSFFKPATTPTSGSWVN